MILQLKSLTRYAVIALSLCPALAARLHAADQSAPASGTGGKVMERNFYDVLEDILGDFEYDLKNGNVQGLKDLSVRNLATSENIPPSFKSHLELVVSERILKTSKTRLVQCLPCRSKRTTLNGDQVIITSADTNPAELSRIAKLAGIAHFMDIAFSYQPSGMVLSLTITDPESGAIIWTRSYNSETSRASAFRRGVDYSQVDDARRAAEYKPTIQYRATLFYMFQPNVSGTTGCLGIGIRGMERYDNRRKEVGFEVDYFKDASTIVGTTSSTAVNLYNSINISMLFMHAWNFIGAEENYNAVRGSAFVGIGGTYASGFLGGLIRSGYEWRLAKFWAVSANLGFRPTATAFLNSSSAGSVSGAEYGLGINLFF